mmetsp:Transcript_1876/g.5321  ORF Transcript_1876/g.5321 Transcript_1876/m.5321 type:complete len:123 (+) Transcript_1876:166-534(+)
MHTPPQEASNDERQQSKRRARHDGQPAMCMGLTLSPHIEESTCPSRGRMRVRRARYATQTQLSASSILPARTAPLTHPRSSAHEQPAILDGSYGMVRAACTCSTNSSIALGQALPPPEMSSS